MSIRLIVGLGNIGKQYEATRHNAGFWWCDALASAQGASFAKDAKFFGLVSKTRSGCLLLKPSTFMNRSGQAVQALASFYRIDPAEILVVHDELDLLPGTSKLKFGGGHAGHNGLRDIQAQLGTGQFHRLRLGIGHPRSLNLQQEVADFVLHQPSKEHRASIDHEIDRSIALFDTLTLGDMAEATRVLHTRPS
jgi:PTH1 family peptidyl-tRNA hydrolase